MPNYKFNGLPVLIDETELHKYGTKTREASILLFMIDVYANNTQYDGQTTDAIASNLEITEEETNYSDGIVCALTVTALDLDSAKSYMHYTNYGDYLDYNDPATIEDVSDSALAIVQRSEVKQVVNGTFRPITSQKVATYHYNQEFMQSDATISVYYLSISNILGNYKLTPLAIRDALRTYLNQYNLNVKVNYVKVIKADNPINTHVDFKIKFNSNEVSATDVLTVLSTINANPIYEV